MSFLVEPKTDLDPSRVFDEQCRESRIEELTKMIMSMLLEEDGKTWAKEHRLKGEIVPPTL